MRIKIRNFIFVASFDFAAFSWTLWFKNHDVIVFLRNWSTVVVLLPAAQLSHTSSHHQGRKLVNEWLEASSSATLDLCLPFAHVYLSIASMIYLFLSQTDCLFLTLSSFSFPLFSLSSLSYTYLFIFLIFSPPLSPLSIYLSHLTKLRNTVDCNLVSVGAWADSAGTKWVSLVHSWSPIHLRKFYQNTFKAFLMQSYDG